MPGGWLRDSRRVRPTTRSPEMQIDHICIAVRSIDAAVAKLCPMFGYTQRTGKVTNTRQKVNVVFMRRKGSLDLKLIEPSGEDSTLWQFLRKGEGLHHVCFLADDTTRGLQELQEHGLRVLSPPAPGEAFDDGLIAFGYAGFGLNVEVIDTNVRRDELKESPIPSREND